MSGKQRDPMSPTKAHLIAAALGAIFLVWGFTLIWALRVGILG